MITWINNASQFGSSISELPEKPYEDAQTALAIKPKPLLHHGERHEKS